MTRRNTGRSGGLKFQQGINRIINRSRNELKRVAAGTGKDSPNFRVRTLRALLWRSRIYVSATRATELLVLHGIMKWTDQERHDLRKERATE